MLRCAVVAGPDVGGVSVLSGHVGAVEVALARADGANSSSVADSDSIVTA